MPSKERPVLSVEQPVAAGEQAADEQPIPAGGQPIARNERPVSPNDRVIPPDECSVLAKELCLPANEPSLPPNELAGSALPEKPAVRLDAYGVLLDESTVANSPMLPYVQMVARLISGVSLSLQEVVTMILQAMRQHSMAGGSGRGYVHGVWRQRPP